MSVEEREFKISGKFTIDTDDVRAYLNADTDDYVPSDSEWEDCAREMFENDDIAWDESSVNPI